MLRLRSGADLLDRAGRTSTTNDCNCAHTLCRSDPMWASFRQLPSPNTRFSRLCFSFSSFTRFIEGNRVTFDILEVFICLWTYHDVFYRPCVLSKGTLQTEITALEMDYSYSYQFTNVAALTLSYGTKWATYYNWEKTTGLMCFNMTFKRQKVTNTLSLYKCWELGYRVS